MEDGIEMALNSNYIQTQNGEIHKFQDKALITYGFTDNFYLSSPPPFIQPLIGTLSAAFNFNDITVCFPRITHFPKFRQKAKATPARISALQKQIPTSGHAAQIMPQASGLRGTSFSGTSPSYLESIPAQNPPHQARPILRSNWGPTPNSQGAAATPKFIASSEWQDASNQSYLRYPMGNRNIPSSSPAATGELLSAAGNLQISGLNPMQYSNPFSEPQQNMRASAGEAFSSSL